MTPANPRPIRRVATVVATMMLVAGIIAMHSFMAGHAPMAPGSGLAGSPHHALVMAAQGPASDRVSTLMATVAPALTWPSSATAHDMTAMCLAVLPALSLLLTVVVLRLRRGQSVGPLWRAVHQQPIGIRGSPARRTTPSLSQLCVLRA